MYFVLQKQQKQVGEISSVFNFTVAKNATYLLPKIQNEIINIIVYDILQGGLINEIKDANFFSIRADEAESYNVEQFPIFIRSVVKNNNIREGFLEFRRCEQLNGKVIVTKIIGVLKKIKFRYKKVPWTRI